MNEYFEELLKLCDKAIINNEVPVAALIVHNNKIIAESYNHRVEENSVLSHAEIDAILKAEQELNDWRLNDCDLYVTLKPCKMCDEIIKASRIKNVFYLMDKNKEASEYNKTNFTKNNDSSLNEKYQEKISLFFKEKRINN